MNYINVNELRELSKRIFFNTVPATSKDVMQKLSAAADTIELLQKEVGILKKKIELISMINKTDLNHINANKLRKISKVIFMATDENVAKGLSITLNKAADTIETLQKKIEKLELDNSYSNFKE